MVHFWHGDAHGSPAEVRRSAAGHSAARSQQAAHTAQLPWPASPSGKARAGWQGTLFLEREPAHGESDIGGGLPQTSPSRAGLLGLSSALRFHELTTENPFEVWIALKQGAWTPRIEYPPIRVVRFSGPSLAFGAVEHVIEGTTIKVYSPAKTVADCFKFRSKIGTELAIQALRESFREKKASMDELWEAAKICRVANVMRPYMESLA